MYLSNVFLFKQIFYLENNLNGIIKFSFYSYKKNKCFLHLTDRDTWSHRTRSDFAGLFTQKIL